MFHDVARTAPTRGNIDEGLVTARDVEDEVEFTCEATTGAPPGNRTFYLCFDTAAADVLVIRKTVADGFQPLPNKRTVSSYDTAATTAVAGDKWTIRVGHGSEADGRVVSDTVTVGGFAIAGQAVKPAEHAVPQRDGTIEDWVKGQGGSWYVELSAHPYDVQGSTHS
jgi:hypothetical protein